MTDNLSAAQERMRDLLKNPDLAKVVGATFADVLVESMDAKREAAHWKTSFETIKREMTVLASVCMDKLKVRRLIITKADFLKVVEQQVQLMYDFPDEDTHIYELKSAKVRTAVEQALAERKRIAHPS